mmetsp:Transcript_8621/g.18767  ORF Transcript_8621/g.18767 Transcript_8621/m.18767 type:complete len:501 (+) Transcript_8621:151-1653(+)
MAQMSAVEQNTLKPKLDSLKGPSKTPSKVDILPNVVPTASKGEFYHLPPMPRFTDHSTITSADRPTEAEDCGHRSSITPAAAILAMIQNKGVGSKPKPPVFPWQPSHTAVYQSLGQGEDRYVSMRVQLGGEDLQLCLLLDGHSGSGAAIACQRHMLFFFVRSCVNDPSALSLQYACAVTFRHFHASILQGTDSDSSCGATLVAVNEYRQYLVCANVGDSRIVHIEGRKRNGGQAFQVLTEDHRFTENKLERARVVGAGAKLSPAAGNGEAISSSGQLLAWPGGLPFGRSLGAASCAEWLSPDPYVSYVDLSKIADSCWVVMCTRSVCDGLPLESIVSLARSHANATAISAAIVQAALEKRSHNGPSQPLLDSTCLTISVGPNHLGLSRSKSIAFAAASLTRLSSITRSHRQASKFDSGDEAETQFHPSYRSQRSAESIDTPCTTPRGSGSPRTFSRSASLPLNAGRKGRIQLRGSRRAKASAAVPKHSATTSAPMRYQQL